MKLLTYSHPVCYYLRRLTMGSKGQYGGGGPPTELTQIDQGLLMRTPGCIGSQCLDGREMDVLET